MKNALPILLLSLICLLSGCHKKTEEEKLKEAMVTLAKDYLKADGITQYDSLRVDCVDTVTELGYANLNSELLDQMADAYQEMYNEAVVNNETKKIEPLALYLKEINRTKADFDNLMENGDLKADGILLFMVTGSYFHGGKKEPIMFLVEPDKKSLHTLDPFGDNLLYRDEN